MKGKINSSTIIVEDFDVPLIILDRTTRQKTHKEIRGHKQPTRSNRCAQNTPPNDNNIHILLKCT